MNHETDKTCPRGETVLHTCCGPCASACVPRLKECGGRVTLFFANANIDSEEEFAKRLGEVRKLAAAENVEVAAAPYNHEDWKKNVAHGFENEPEKGERCRRCYEYNMSKAAEFAASRGASGWTTSLTVSPHKPSAAVFAAGESAAAAAGSPFLKVDFKKKNGFLMSLKRSAELGLYRQSYCGCEFSKRPGRTTDRAMQD